MNYRNVMLFFLITSPTLKCRACGGVDDFEYVRSRCGIHRRRQPLQQRVHLYIPTPWRSSVCWVQVFYISRVLEINDDSRNRRGTQRDESGCGHGLVTCKRARFIATPSRVTASRILCDLVAHCLKSSIPCRFNSTKSM